VIGGLATSDRVRHRQIAQLPALLHGLAREMRAGRSLQQAVRDVAGAPAVVGVGLGEVVQRIDAGAGVVTTIDRWAAELDHPDADLVRAVLNTGVTNGGAMAASLDRAADSLRERAELRREIRALSSQARTSALVLTIAPVVFLVLMSSLDPTIVSAVIGTTIGRVGFVAGVVLDVAGWLWMRRMVVEVAR
jgi:tight adherence protein B